MLEMEFNCTNISSTAAVIKKTLRQCPTSEIDGLKTFKIVMMSIVLFVIFLASVAGNLLVFVVFYKRPNLLTISNRFIVNLSVCNSLNTVFVMPFMFVAMIAQQWVFGAVLCHATGFLMNTIFAASTLTLVVISIDRYCAVVNPLHYSMRITPQRAVFMVMSVWTVAVLSSLPPLLGWNHFEYQADKTSCTVMWATPDIKDRYYTLFLVTVCFLLPLFVMLWAYAVIFRAARNNSERARRNSVVPTNQQDDASQTPLRTDRRRSSSAPILTRRISSASRTVSLLWRRDEWKAAVTSLLVVSTFIICWLPYFIIIVLESTFADPTTINDVVETLSILLAMSSCAFNPIVYVFRSKMARQELRSILRLKSKNETNAETRRSSNTPSVRDSPVLSRNGSESSDITEKPLHLSATTTTLTSLITVHECEAVIT